MGIGSSKPRNSNSVIDLTAEAYHLQEEHTSLSRDPEVSSGMDHRVPRLTI